MINIDPAFGHWFTGFVDGEGSFNIRCNRSVSRPGEQRLSYGCHFSIGLREDDRLILEEIQALLGIGRIYPVPARGRSKPKVIFTTQSKSDNLIIRDIFRKFPLRAKKANDFEIWSRALDHLLSRKRGDSWSEMTHLKEQIEEVRKYVKLS